MRKIIILLVSFLIFCFNIQFSFSQWVNLTTNTSEFLYGEYFLNKDTGFVFGDYSTLLKTTDGGNNWTSIPINPLSAFTAMDFITPQVGYLVGVLGINSGIFKSIDGGNNWVAQNCPTQTLLYSVDFTDSLNGIVVGDDATILRTSDGGLSWLQLPKPLLLGDSIYELRTVQFINDSIGFAAGGKFTGWSGGIVIKTIDGGNTWNKIFEAYNFQRFTQIEFINDSVGWASATCHHNNIFCAGGRILHTQDGGINWQETVIDTNTMSTAIYIADLMSLDVIENNIYSVGYGSPTILASFNNGLTWQYQYPLNLIYPYQVFFTDSLTGYIVGDNGKVLKTINGGVGFTDITPLASTKIYPNPSNGNFMIYFNNNFSERTIQIFDVTGKIIYKKNKIKNSKEEVNLASYPKGVYFLKIIDKEKISVSKILIQ